MSLELIPYQPLPFGIEDNCTLPCANWIQKIQKSDATSIQFRYGACGTAGTVLTNGDFASGGTGWTENGAWVFTTFLATSPIGTSGFIEQVPAIGVDGYYEISFNCNVNVGVLVVSTTSGALLNYYSTSGNYTLSTFLEVGDSINFYFNTALGGNVSNIIARPINISVAVGVLDLDGYLLVLVNPSLFTFKDGFFTVNIDWDALDLDDGCYKLGIIDPCACSQFGFAGDDFQIPNQWRVITGAATIASGVMTFTFFGQTQVRSRALLCPNVKYFIEYTLAGMNPSDDFQVRIGTTTGTLRTADGTYTETISTNFAGDIEVRFIANNAVDLSSFTVTDFTISAVDPVITYESVDFQLKETHTCSVLVEACGVGEQFNFGFNGTGFKPVIRLEGTYRGSNYPMSKTEYEYSTGEKSTPYMRTRKAKTFLFGAPEYVFDFAQLWLGISNLYIDGVLMASEDSETPTIALEDDVDFGIATFTFSKKIELTEKRSCTTLPDIGCTDDGYSIYILKTGGSIRNDLPTIGTADGRELRFGI
tara:strand:+ start:8570 stop:10171 length:1602 start_codon:yes stop_codon:yes gene_type:complete